MADGRQQQEVGDSHWEGAGVITQKLTRKLGSHFPFASHFWWEQEVGVGGGAVTQKLRRKVGSRQPRMRGHCCKPVLLAPNQARSVPSPSSSGQETYCPLLLRRVVGGLRGGLGTPSNANNLRWVVVITDKPSQVRRNQTDIGSLLPQHKEFALFFKESPFHSFFSAADALLVFFFFN